MFVDNLVSSQQVAYKSYNHRLGEIQPQQLKSSRWERVAEMPETLTVDDILEVWNGRLKHVGSQKNAPWLRDMVP